MIQFQLEHPTLRLAAIAASNVTCEPSARGLLDAMSTAETLVRSDASAFPEVVRREVRDVLRVGGYKPTGRGKPASEFLLGTAQEQGLPVVNNLVDINNLISLTTALPISIFDRRLLGDHPSIRFGRPGERYVFNASGQTMDIAGIPVICGGIGDEPIGNAVKDSMLAKVSPDTRNVLAVVYGSQRLPAGLLERAATELEIHFTKYAGATASETSFVPK